jgi:hypothetical protein
MLPILATMVFATQVLATKILAAKVWTYWISLVLVGGVVLVAVGTAIGYLVKVYSTRFPKQ